MKQKKKAKEFTKRKGNRGSPDDLHIIAWLPPMLTIICVPLIVRSVSSYNTLAEYFYKNESFFIENDVFLIAKGWGIYFTAGLGLFFVLCMLLLNRKFNPHSRLMLLPACYLGLALLSSVLSIDRGIAFKGSQDLHQPFSILTGYIVLFYYTYLLASRMKEDAVIKSYRLLLRSSLMLSGILSLIGILQLTGHDPFSWNFVQTICGLQGSEILNSGRIYMTLYHPDYVGMMLAMLIPIISSGISVEEKPIRYLYIIIDILLLICLWASKTRSGIMAFLLVSIIALISSAWRYIRTGREKNLRAGVVILGLLFILTAGTLLTKNPLSERFFRYSEDTVFPRDGVTGIETGKESVRIRIGSTDYFLSWKDIIKPQYRSTAGDTIILKECSEEEKKGIAKKLRKKKIQIEMSDCPVYLPESADNCYLIQVTLSNPSGPSLEGYAIYDGRDIWLIAKDTEKSKYLLMNRDNNLTESIISEDAFPDSFYGFASDRGYIWSKTIAKLHTTVLYGTGPDTFPLYFPNNDYVARHLIKDDHIIINKPHNWYLQMAAETGVISATIMIVFLIYYLWNTFKKEITSETLKKTDNMTTRQKNHSRSINTGIGLSILAYMITALANDSMVVCAPVFWIILGYGSGIISHNQE